MSPFSLTRFDSDQELAQSAAAAWLRELGAGSGGSPYCVALSGGRIARRFFAAVANLAKAGSGALSRVHYFWGDERCVPPTDPESNFRLARELLLQPLMVPEQRTHRIFGEQEPETAAAAAAAELGRVAPARVNRQPVLDLVFLGMGEDGHVASLFPGEAENVTASPAVYRAVTATKPPPRRITLGYAAIAAARDVWVLASGAGKEKALRDSLAPSGNTPLARVLKLRQGTRIFTDIAG